MPGARPSRHTQSRPACAAARVPLSRRARTLARLQIFGPVVDRIVQLSLDVLAEGGRLGNVCKKARRGLSARLRFTCARCQVTRMTAALDLAARSHSHKLPCGIV